MILRNSFRSGKNISSHLYSNLCRNRTEYLPYPCCTHFRANRISTSSIYYQKTIEKTIEKDPTEINPRIPTTSTFQLVSKLSKRNLSALVVLTSGAGYVMSAGPLFNLGTFTALIVGTSLSAASAAAFNQLIEHKYDALMARTANRPIVTGEVSLSQAKMFGWGTGIAGVGILTALTTPVTGLLGLSTIVIYTHAYTPLKRKTKYNTEIGAIVGAIPPIMGWTAALNTTGVFSSEAFLLACTLFSWQMHHFMTIAWLRRRDYANAGFVMQSLGDESGKSTAGKGLFWAASMTLLPYAAYVSEITASPCAIGTGTVNLFLLYYYIRFYLNRTTSNARKAMLAGVAQLVFTFFLMAVFMKKHEGATGFFASLGDFLNIDMPKINSFMKDTFCLKSASVVSLPLVNSDQEENKKQDQESK